MIACAFRRLNFAICGVISVAPCSMNSSATTSTLGAWAANHSFAVFEKSRPESVFSFSIATFATVQRAPRADSRPPRDDACERYASDRQQRLGYQAGCAHHHYTANPGGGSHSGGVLAAAADQSR